MTGATLPGRPFSVAVEQSVLTDLRDRLTRTRWPIAPAGDAWAFGASLSYVRKLVDHWRDHYDWRAWEQRINRFAQQIVRIDDIDIHVIVEPGSGPAPLPLILTHGWPGSFVEFLDLIEPLAHPERFGGKAEDGFTVVVPSLPGYGFSGAPARPVSPQQVAGMWHKLMTGLGFDSYVAHGSDWGGLVTTWLGLEHHPAVRAIHLTGGGVRAPWTHVADPLDESEQAFLAAVGQRWQGETGYQAIQSTKPLSLSYGLTDSPAGLAAWVAEKFHRWTDRGGGDEPLVDLDQLITNIMMHWLPGPGPASWMYTFFATSMTLPEGRKVEAPTGLCYFPEDCGREPPERILHRSYNFKGLTVASGGGHFPGIERPAELEAAVRQFFAAYR